MKFQCPICRAALHQHQESQGWYCDAKHHFDRHEKGYWNFFGAKKPQNADSRQALRARQFMLLGGHFAPAIEALATELEGLNLDSPECVNLGQGNAWLGKALIDVLQCRGHSIASVSPLESENEAFAAAKAGLPGVCLTGLKSLPFATEAADMVWLLDTLPKGLEWQRVLKQGGYALLLAAGPRHLWQLKEFVYSDLSEKPFSFELPKSFEVVRSETVAWTVSVSAEDALVLLDMAPWGWRVKEAQRKAIARGDFSALEMDYRVIVARKG
ncbi:SAM-dependent methyltransferase [Shewanella sp. JM162201]|uniref:SAM-dependent methyltransferase n=1 Tax=Shewanella jiangmenensis TaxID=2837387 RepID=A0ABS5V1W4_9GAMM|nr:SAM-dependent methyltransferase [Shewanella jiangmenensis]MBT1444457.1 SAM-dependent methyltransferase [Shewanella jiangmenensis]